MTANEIIKNWKTLHVKWLDDKVVKISEPYPICLNIENNESAVYVDTGGSMDGAMFFSLKIDDNGKVFWKAPETGEKWKPFGQVVKDK